MKKATLLISLLVLVFSANAQQIPLLKPTEVSLQSFASSALNEPVQPQNLENLVSNDNIIPDDLKEVLGANPGYYHGYMGLSNVGINLNLGMKVRNNETNEYYKSPVLRAGFQFYSISTINSYGRIKESHRVDTLSSTSSNSSIFIDSVEDRSLYVSKQAELINVDFSLIFRTDTSKLWSLFGGAGFSTGVSINSYTRVNVRDHSHYEYRGDYNAQGSQSYYGLSSWGGREERHHNKMNFMANVYLPLGVDVRLGQQTAFWRRLHLFYEFRPGLSVLTVPEIGTITGVSITHGVGLMVRF